MRRKKKDMKLKYIVLLGMAFIVLLFVIFSFTLKEDRNLNKFEWLVKDSVIAIERVVLYPFNYVVDKVGEFFELRDIREKYEVLKNSLNRVDSIEAENKLLRKELEDMKEELNISHTLTEYEYLNATVISRNVSYWYNTFTIDKGSHNGVLVDMVVVNAQGLIGKVVSVTAFTSNVKLLSTNDKNNKISVLISNSDNTNYYGVINGYNYNDKSLIVEGISNTDHIEDGAYVYTSGLGGVFPRGILVGTVSSIITDEYDLSKIIKVKPSADFEDINYVAVLKRKSV